MVKKRKKSNQYVPKKGFGWAVFCMFFGIFTLCYGIQLNDFVTLLITVILGIIGLFWVKKSWVPYKSVKKNIKKKK